MAKDNECGTCGKPTVDTPGVSRCTCAADGVGGKFDGDKLRWDLLPIVEVEQVVKILTDGANKYADNNWQKVPEARRRYYAAAMRHLTAWKKGEEIDPDSGSPHVSHAICCLLFIGWMDNNNEQREEKK